MFDRIHQANWMTLSKETRNHLLTIFHIPKTGICEIRDNDVISDGVTAEDLRCISKVKMMEYVNCKEDCDFPKLWELTLFKAKHQLSPIEIVSEVIVSQETPVVEEIKKYCATCTSTKGRHKKGCPKFK